MNCNGAFRSNPLAARLTGWLSDWLTYTGFGWPFIPSVCSSRASFQCRRRSKAQQHGGGIKWSSQQTLWLQSRRHTVEPS